MTDDELFSCTDTHHFIRGEVDETRQNEEITASQTSDKEKFIREDGRETDIQNMHHYLHMNKQSKCVMSAGPTDSIYQCKASVQ